MNKQLKCPNGCNTHFFPDARGGYICAHCDEWFDADSEPLPCNTHERGSFELGEEGFPR